MISARSIDFHSFIHSTIVNYREKKARSAFDWPTTISYLPIFATKTLPPFLNFSNKNFTKRRVLVLRVLHPSGNHPSRCRRKETSFDQLQIHQGVRLFFNNHSLTILFMNGRFPIKSPISPTATNSATNGRCSTRSSRESNFSTTSWNESLSKRIFC